MFRTMKVGRVCVKTMGREAGLPCVIIEELDNNFVRVDGLTKRRRCNKDHLAPQTQVLKIKKKAKTEDVIDAMIKANIIKKEQAEHRRGKKTKKKKPKKKKKKEKKPKKEEGGEDYSSMTKSEVYDVAKELGVKGRSKMAKKELIKAVKKAEK